MIFSETTFLEAVSPAARKALVSMRIAAMRGQLHEVCKNIKAQIDSTGPENRFDLVALGMLWSEMLHLDKKDTDSLSVFNEFVELHLLSLPTAVQLVAAENLSCIQMAAWHEDATSTFYHFVDRRRIAQFEAIERDNLIAAQSAIEGERFNEALSLLWQNLQRAYALGSWQATKWAADRLANLYFMAGSLDDACHYVIIAEADKGMERLAAETSRRGDPTIIRGVLRRLMDFANLARHFTVACKYIATIPDLIPDADVENLVEWLLPRCREQPDFNGGGAMRAAWEAIRELGHRVSSATSRKLIDIALSHPVWHTPPTGENRASLYREVMVKAVTFLVHSAPKDYLPEVLDSTLPLATDRFHDHDYGDVINLLCNLSKLGGNSIREKTGAALYVQGKPINRILAQIAGIFGIEALNPAQWEEFANKVIEETRLTVQRLSPGETPKPVGETLMTMNQTTPTGQLQVTIHGGVGIEALNRGKKHLSDATIERIVRVLVEMAMNPDNLLSNREMLLSQVCGFADRTPTDLRDEVVCVIEPLARGEVAESTEYPNAAAGQQPLAFARMNMGTPQQVQAMAIVTVAAFCASDSARSRKISDALFDGFVSPHVAVRRGAYAAARRLPGLSGEQILPVLMGLRDADPKAAIAAFAAFAERPEWPLTRPMWKMFLLAIRLASQSADSNLRRHAALALHARLKAVPTEATRIEARAIMEVFSKDVAYSVRTAVSP